MGELGALFNPGMRHELEERQAKAARREEEGNAKDGDLRIDLESGVAVISAPGGEHSSKTENSAPNRSTPVQPAGTSATDGADDTAARAAAPATSAQPPTVGEPAAIADGSGPERRRAAPAPTDPAAGPRPRGKRGLSASAR